MHNIRLNEVCARINISNFKLHTLLVTTAKENRYDVLIATLEYNDQGNEERFLPRTKTNDIAREVMDCVWRGGCNKLWPKVTTQSRLSFL